MTLDPRAAGEAVAGEAIRIAEAVAEAVAFNPEIPAAASRPEQAPRPHPQSVGDKISVLWKPTLTAALQGHVATRLACAPASWEHLIGLVEPVKLAELCYGIMGSVHSLREMGFKVEVAFSCDPKDAAFNFAVGT